MLDSFRFQMLLQEKADALREEAEEMTTVPEEQNTEETDLNVWQLNWQQWKHEMDSEWNVWRSVQLPIYCEGSSQNGYQICFTGELFIVQKRLYSVVI